MSAADDGAAHASLNSEDQGNADHQIVTASGVVPFREPFGHRIEIDGHWYPVERVTRHDDSVVIHYGVDSAEFHPLTWVPIRQSES